MWVQTSAVEARGHHFRSLEMILFMQLRVQLSVQVVGEKQFKLVNNCSIIASV